MALSLAKELEMVGCNRDPEQFRELIKKVFWTNYQNWTDEDLLCRPDDSKRYCNLVRTESATSLGDYAILRTLTNVRKNGSCSEPN